MIGAHIFSVEEMRERLAGGPCKETVPIATPADIRDEVARRVEAKIAETRQRKMTPSEIRQGLDLLFAKHDFSPVEELIQIAKRTDNEATTVRICCFLTEFFLPKLKSIEVSGQVDHNHTVVIRRYGDDGKHQDKVLDIKPKAPGVLRPGSGASTLSLGGGQVERRVERAIDAEVVR